MAIFNATQTDLKDLITPDIFEAIKPIGGMVLTSRTQFLQSAEPHLQLAEQFSALQSGP